MQEYNDKILMAGARAFIGVGVEWRGNQKEKIN
jgi:hypothetical protein